MIPPWGYAVRLRFGDFVAVLVPAVVGWDEWAREAAALALEKAIRS